MRDLSLNVLELVIILQERKSLKCLKLLTPKLTNKRHNNSVRNESPAKLLKQTMTSAREASKQRNTARNISKPVLNKAA